MICKRLRALVLCLVMLSSLVVLSACKKDDGGAPSGDSQQTTTPTVAEGEALYSVSVVDGVGRPYSEKIIVKILQGQEQVAMLKVNVDGVAKKALPKGDYQVEVMSTDGNTTFYYDAAAAVLTPDKTQLQVILSQELGDAFDTIHATSSSGEQAPFSAYYVSTGTTHVKVDAGERNYFLFVPSEPGAYEITTSADAVIGVYGASIHFVTEHSTNEMKDGKLSFSVQPSMIGSGETGTSVYVLGLDVEEGISELLLNVIRTGEAEWSFTEQPWINYQPKNEISPFVLGENIVLKQFDLTADSYELVLNPEDGCYHVGSADGPKVYVQLSEPCYSISLMNMVGEIVYKDGVLMQTGTAPFRYSYDNGKDDFFKEDYTDAMREYVTARDKKTGVYPLNEDLYYMLPLGIQAMGWCRENTANFLFRDAEDVNLDIAWMFLLCYEDMEIPVDPSDPTTEPTKPSEPTEPADCSHAYAVTSRKDATCTEKGSVVYTCSKCSDSYTEELSAKGHQYSDGKCSTCGLEDPIYQEKPSTVIHDNKDNPDVISGTLQFEASVQAGHLHYYDVYRVSGTYLTIAHKDAYVMYDGKVYEAKNGVVTVPGLQSDGMNFPVQLAIGNNGDEDATFTVVMSYPAGTKMNPYTLNLGSFTTKIDAGNNQGVYYTYTATKDGVLTIRLDSVAEGVAVDITMTTMLNEVTTVQVTLEESGGNNISLDVMAGQTVEIIISSLPDQNFQYPAATVRTTASIA